MPRGGCTWVQSCDGGCNEEGDVVLGSCNGQHVPAYVCVCIVWVGEGGGCVCVFCVCDFVCVCACASQVQAFCS